MRLARNFQGFSLIEVLVVAGLMVLMSSLMIRNFSSTRLDFDKIANQLEADVRLAQSNALSSKKVNDAFRCGYGITWIGDSTYDIYAGKDTAVSSCASDSSPNFRFVDAASTPIVKTIILDSRIRVLNFQDIFFLPPDPRLYRDNGNQPTKNPQEITLRKNSVSNCNGEDNCRYVCVYPSGKVEVYRSSNQC